MRKITLTYFNEEKDKEFLLHVVNNSLKFTIFNDADGKILIYSKIHSKWDELGFKMVLINFNETLCEEIVKLIYNTHELIPSIKTSDACEEQDYSLKFKGKIEAMVNSLVNKYSYDENNNGLLEFMSVLLIRIARAHAWNNGNKRTAIVSIHKIFQSFGYFVKWSNSGDTYIQFWENMMCRISGKAEEDDLKLPTEEELVKIVKEKIIDNIAIDAKKCR